MLGGGEGLRRQPGRRRPATGDGDTRRGHEAEAAAKARRAAVAALIRIIMALNPDEDVDPNENDTGPRHAASGQLLSLSSILEKNSMS